MRIMKIAKISLTNPEKILFVKTWSSFSNKRNISLKYALYPTK
jgi:hypothetical protein